MVEVKFKKLVENAVIPTKAHPTDVGFDLTATKVNVTENYVEYETGIALQLPVGYCALLFPRSSNSKKDLLLANSVGLVDNGYIGELKLRFKRIMMPVMQEVMIAPPTGDILTDARNTRKVPGLAYRDDHIYKVGDKIGQLVIMPYPEVTLTETNELYETDRGDGGFGSTDIKKDETTNS